MRAKSKSGVVPSQPRTARARGWREEKEERTQKSEHKPGTAQPSQQVDKAGIGEAHSFGVRVWRQVVEKDSRTVGWWEDRRSVCTTLETCPLPRNPQGFLGRSGRGVAVLIGGETRTKLEEHRGRDQDKDGHPVQVPIPEGVSVSRV